MNSFPFNVAKAAMAAAWLVAKAGGKMNHIKLSKLLYIADREALRKWGRPIIGGIYSSMKHGPVISPVVNYLKPLDTRLSDPVWDNCFRREGNFLVLVNNPGRGQLHDAAIKLLDDIFSKCQTFNQWQVRDFTHKFPEYSDPGDSSTTIEMDKLFKALNKDENEIEVLSKDLEHFQMVYKLAGC